jgi:hypothetical protein
MNRHAWLKAHTRRPDAPVDRRPDARRAAAHLNRLTLNLEQIERLRKRRTGAGRGGPGHSPNGATG